MLGNTRRQEMGMSETALKVQQMIKGATKVVHHGVLMPLTRVMMPAVRSLTKTTLAMKVKEMMKMKKIKVKGMMKMKKIKVKEMI